MRKSDLYGRVGKNLATRRRGLKYSQAKVAKRAEISRPSLANMEIGNQTISLFQLYKLAIALELEDARELLPVSVLKSDEFEAESEEVKIGDTTRLNPDHISEVQEIIAAWGAKK